MPIPDSWTLCRPVLEKCAAGEVKTSDVVDALAEEFVLTPEERARPRPNASGTVFENRVHFAMSKLTTAGLMPKDRPEKTLSITQEGLDALRTGPEKFDNNFLKRFPEYTARRERKGTVRAKTKDVVQSQDRVQVSPPLTGPEPGHPVDSYSIADILKEGCFLGQGEIELLLERLRTKKNLILQGPPGTGKTWIARRLAYALMGAKDESKVRVVQFHPNLSYEDFVRGWRPTGDGKLALADGVFLEAIRTASENPSSNFAVVIEEINRGNPAQIFGELVTLLEADKRTPEEAVELCYSDADGKRRPIHVPRNLHVIGTMNIADRSLALVDLAFRRRFAFATLEPKLGDAWRTWVVRERGVDPELARDIERRVGELNQQIAEALGNQFRIGHSYVTPTHRLEGGTTRDWFAQVAETEIGPLLEEYWFDSPKTARDALHRLVEGW